MTDSERVKDLEDRIQDLSKQLADSINQQGLLRNEVEDIKKRLARLEAGPGTWD